MRCRILVGFIIALLLGLPAFLPEKWLLIHWHVEVFVTLSNLPGSLCGLLFGGRFFPPEGFIGQNLTRWVLMVMVQTFVWFLILSVVHFVVTLLKNAIEYP